MINRLSHSQATKFASCAQSWKYHYQDGIRSTTKSGALFFGSAVDVPLECMLSPEKYPGQTPEQLFDKHWHFQEHNGKQIYLPTSTQVVYANKDYDPELMIAEDWVKLQNTIDKNKRPSDEGKTPEAVVDEIYAAKETLGFDSLPDDRKIILNHANWLSLYRKGLYMLDTYRKEIVPNIVKVLGTQVPVSLKNAEGDEIIGFADLVCLYRYQDQEVVVIFDNKTSSREYERDSVITSPQLSLYLHDLAEKFKTRVAGYIVINKAIRKKRTKICSICSHNGTGTKFQKCNNEISGKRCNGEWNETLSCKAHIDVIINEIPSQTEDIVIQNMDYINQSIKNGVFHRNFSSCRQNWGKCEFFDLCFYNKMDGLEIKQKEEVAAVV